MELALGTVQWGMVYGIAGRGSRVPENEVRGILEAAWDAGVRMLDTAAAYGDIEQRLGALAGSLPFRIISKIPALPAGLSERDAVDWAISSASRSYERLGERLGGLMCHQAQDLCGARGAAVWSALGQWAGQRKVVLGASVYAPQVAVELAKERGIALTQLPGNALDQRIAREMPRAVPGLEVHLRSAFLQGLLLMDFAAAAARLPAAAQALQRWQRWCADSDVQPLVGALAVCKGFEPVSVVVVGVDSVQQFVEVTRAWQAAHPVRAETLACDAPEVIDPRFWSTPQ